MKKLFYVFLIATVSVATSCGSKNKKEPAEDDMEDMTKTEHAEEATELAVINSVGGYGKEITNEGAITMPELLTAVRTSSTYRGKVQGEIDACCQNKGCWMKMDAGNGKTMMVTFKDYGFFVPKDIPGKKVVIQGEAKMEKISVEEQKHLAEDAGKPQAEIDAITTEKEELVFVADGVLTI